MTEQRKSLISRNTILAIGLAALAFTWPWEAQKAGTQEKGETSAPAQTLESVVEEESVSVNWDEKGTPEAGVEVTDDEGAAVSVVRPARIARTAYTPVTPLPPRPVANALTVPVTTYNTTKAVQPVQPPIDISIQNIQKQISDIIRLNETIKASQQAQVVE
ncbi:MAG TPA: hypothetical protein VD913_02780, partial [bacterium]|nr:hypothetical protein [bacterium]